MRNALLAILALIDGNFDAPSLNGYLLSGDKEADIKDIAECALINDGIAWDNINQKFIDE